MKQERIVNLETWYESSGEEVVTDECGPETASVELGVEALIDVKGKTGTQRTPEQWRTWKT